MHGGAPGTGAPAGNRNALKHGRYSHEMLEFRRMVRELAREARELVEIADGFRCATALREIDAIELPKPSPGLKS